MISEQAPLDVLQAAPIGDVSLPQLEQLAHLLRGEARILHQLQVLGLPPARLHEGPLRQPPGNLYASPQACPASGRLMAGSTHSSRESTRCSFGCTGDTDASLGLRPHLAHALLTMPSRPWAPFQNDAPTMQEVPPRDAGCKGARRPALCPRRVACCWKDLLP